MASPRGSLTFSGRWQPVSSNSAIAHALSLSRSSIEKHVSAIFSKLGLAEEPRLHRRVAAVVTYLREVEF